MDWGYFVVHLEVYWWTKGANSMKGITIFMHDVCFPKLARPPLHSTVVRVSARGVGGGQGLIPPTASNSGPALNLYTKRCKSGKYVSDRQAAYVSMALCMTGHCLSSPKSDIRVDGGGGESESGL